MKALLTPWLKSLLIAPFLYVQDGLQVAFQVGLHLLALLALGF